MAELFDGSQDSGEVDPSEPKKIPLTESSAVPTEPMTTTKPKPTPDEYSEVLRKERPAAGTFKAFVAKPLNLHFDAQTSEERILLMLRRHPITQIPWILIAVVASVLPFGIGALPILSLVPDNYLFAAIVGWYLLLTGFILESFLSWFFNVYIITDERIIDVDFVSLIYKNVSSAKIDNIEDVTARTGGALQSIFNYGTVAIQTAAEKREFEFEDVPQPAKVTRLLNELLLEEEREKLEGRVS